MLATDLRQGCEAASRLVADIMPEVGYVRQGFAVYEKEVTHEAREGGTVDNLNLENFSLIIICSMIMTVGETCI